MAIHEISKATEFDSVSANFISLLSKHNLLTGNRQFSPSEIEFQRVAEKENQR